MAVAACSGTCSCRVACWSFAPGVTMWRLLCPAWKQLSGGLLMVEAAARVSRCMVKMGACVCVSCVRVTTQTSATMPPAFWCLAGAPSPSSDTHSLPQHRLRHIPPPSTVCRGFTRGPKSCSWGTYTLKHFIPAARAVCWGAGHKEQQAAGQYACYLKHARHTRPHLPLHIRIHGCSSKQHTRQREAAHTAHTARTSWSGETSTCDQSMHTRSC